MTIFVRLRQIFWIALCIAVLALVDSDYVVILAALVAIGVVAIETRAPLRDLGLTRPRSIVRTLAFGMLVGVVMLLLSKLLLTPVIEALTGIPRDLSAFDFLRGETAKYFAILPRIWLSAAIGEEIVFRAFLIGRLETAFGGASRIATTAAVVLASLVFGAAHAYQGPTGILLTATLGLVFGIVYVASGRNLWFNVVVHGVYDTLSLALVLTSFDRVLNEIAHRILPH